MLEDSYNNPINFKSKNQEVLCDSHYYKPVFA